MGVNTRIPSNRQTAFTEKDNQSLTKPLLKFYGGLTCLEK